MNYQIAFAVVTVLLVLSMAFNFVSVLGINYIKAKLGLAIQGLEYYSEEGICFVDKFHETVRCNQFAIDILIKIRKKF